MVETGGCEGADVLTVWRVKKKQIPRHALAARARLRTARNDNGNGAARSAYRDVNKCPILSFFVFR